MAFGRSTSATSCSDASTSATTSSETENPNCHPCSRSTVLPIFPVAHLRWATLSRSWRAVATISFRDSDQWWRMTWAGSAAWRSVGRSAVTATAHTPSPLRRSPECAGSTKKEIQRRSPWGRQSDSTDQSSSNHQSGSCSRVTTRQPLSDNRCSRSCC